MATARRTGKHGQATTRPAKRKVTAAKPSPKPAARKRATKKAAPAPTRVQVWLTDPMNSGVPVQIAEPALPGTSLKTEIVAPTPAPPAQVHTQGTPEFRYWTAAAALRRAANLWSAAQVNAWQPAIGSALPVRLDDGVDLNAYYARTAAPAHGIRQGLTFFHDTVVDSAGQSVTVYSGESSDVIAHELGHAALDALKPALWSVSTTEVAALHESFGDISAILSAMSEPEVARALLQETGGQISRNSVVSRIAEQLGFALRTRRPSSVDPDALRNAANSFTYADPVTLPTTGPASGLTRQPHNFSRVFTGAFLEALGGMLNVVSSRPDEDDVAEVARDMAVLLVRAIPAAPIRTRMFQSVAEQLVLAGNGGRYAQALTRAFVRRGILPVSALASPDATDQPTFAQAAAAAVMRTAAIAGGVGDEGHTTAIAAEPVRVVLPGHALGIPFAAVYADAPAVDDRVVRFGVATAENASPVDTHAAVAAFVEELVVRGQISLAGQRHAARTALIEGIRSERFTHELVQVDEGVEIRRLRFSCGCGGGAETCAEH